MQKTVLIPEEVKLDLEKFKISVEGPLGKLDRDFHSPLFAKKIKIEKADKRILIKCEFDKRKIKSQVGTIAAHINNMIKGVMKGWEYRLKIVYLHFPMTVKVEGDKITVNNFLGGKANRYGKIIGDTKVEIKGDEITVTGINKEDVGQTTLNIENSTRVRSRDRRVFQDGIFMITKGEKK